MSRKRHKVAPISTVILLLDMSLQPTVCIGGMHEVDLAPFKLTGRAIRRILSIWLHATNDSVVGYKVCRSITVVTSVSMGDAQCRDYQALGQVTEHHSSIVMMLMLIMIKNECARICQDTMDREIMKLVL